MIKKTEDKLQQQIVTYFNNKYCTKFQKPSLIIHSTPNGGFRDKIEAVKLNRTGLVAGTADLTIKGINSRFVDVEVKLPNQKQSSKQIEMQQKLKDLNCNYIVVYSLDDFIEKINPLIPFLTCE